MEGCEEERVGGVDDGEIAMLSSSPLSTSHPSGTTRLPPNSVPSQSIPNEVVLLGIEVVADNLTGDTARDASADMTVDVTPDVCGED